MLRVSLAIQIVTINPKHEHYVTVLCMPIMRMAAFLTMNDAISYYDKNL